MNKELIVAITEHRKFGVILIPYLITPTSGNSLYSVIDKATPNNIKDIEEYNDDFLHLIKISGEIDDIYMARLFSKEPPQEFLTKVNQEFIEQRIRPHIELRLKKMMDLIADLNLRLFYKDRQYSQIYASDLITQAEKGTEAIFIFHRDEKGIRYHLVIQQGDNRIGLRNKKSIVITDFPCNVVIDQVWYHFRNIDSKKLTPFFEKEFIQIAKSTEKTYFEKFVLNTIRNFTVQAIGFEVNDQKIAPRALLYFQNDLEGLPTLLLKFRYGGKIILPNNPDAVFVEMFEKEDNFTFNKTHRTLEAEKSYVAVLRELGFYSKDNIHFYIRNMQEGPQTDWFYATVSTLNQLGGELKNRGFEIKQEFFSKKYYLNQIDLQFNLNQTNDWFDLQGNVTLGNYTFPFIKLRRNILKDIREYELPDGSIVILPSEWFSRYKELFQLAQTQNQGLIIRKYHFGLLNFSGFSSAKIEEMKKLFSKPENASIALPSGLNARLRPYQLTGYYWMEQLKKNGFGGCLADDMGLGKTLQTLTLLLNSTRDIITVKKINPEATGQLSLFDLPQTIETIEQRCPTSLIIMPLSLIHNWNNEIQRFAPELKTYSHIGGYRTKNIDDFKNYDLILTTYGLARNDFEMMSQFPFHYIVLDESQAIKNPSSKNYQAVTQLKSNYKLVLTGTPIENSLTDLWAQMNFLNPGLLGHIAFFKDEYVSPIEKGADAEKSKKLQGFIEPFILRRTKDQVAKELPAKTEQTRYCSMDEEQQKLYESQKSAIRNTLLEFIDKHGSNKSSVMVLQALTRLRQLANHPKLAGFEQPSGKFDEVTRVLGTVLSENHKVLMFSSFVQHLKLYEEYLIEQGIKYSMLTGNTQNREEVIASFQNDNQSQVFLISLKAGGVGLNLTAADYVFMLDPWWNPAAENQAISRAHRIGQDKKVFVYRFITSDTLEEKIVKLQNQKSELANQFVNSNNPLRTLSTEDIMELFQ